MKKFLILASVIALASCKKETILLTQPTQNKITPVATVQVNKPEPVKIPTPFKVKKSTIIKKTAVRPVNTKDSLYLAKLLQRFEDVPQIFTVSSTGITTITGKGGTVITINPDDLKTKNDTGIQSAITVELKELLDTQSLLKNNAQTMSGNKLLVSGGSYYIGLKCDGNELELKPEKTLAVRFPKITDDGMELFYGDNSKGQMDWQKASVDFKIPPTAELRIDNVAFANVNAAGNFRRGQNFFSQEDTITGDPRNVKLIKAEKEVSKKLYRAIELNKLGWINCDRFNNGQKTNLAYKIEQPDTIAHAATFLVFKDINSVVCSQYRPGNNKIYQMPVNRKATFITIAVKDEKIYAQASDIIIKPGMLVECGLKEISEKEMAQLFETR